MAKLINLSNDVKLNIYSTNLNDNFSISNTLPAGVDLNTITIPGMYRLSGTVTNGPNNAAWSQMLVIYAGADTGAQLIFPYNGAQIAYRAWNGYNSFRSWSYLTQTTS